MTPLENYYCGDEAFAHLIAAISPLIESARAEWPAWPNLVALCGDDEQLARGVFYVADVNALAWMRTPAPVLDGLSAVDCLSTTSGQHRLKEAILRYGGMT